MARPTAEATITRVVAWLQAHPASSSYDVAAGAYIVNRHAQLIIRYLHIAGWAHIASWRKSTGTGNTVRLWAYGPGTDANKPGRDSWAVVRKRRKNTLRDKYGKSLAHKILTSRKYGGAAVLCLDGEVVYRRGVPRGRSGKFSVGS